MKTSWWPSRQTSWRLLAGVAVSLGLSFGVSAQTAPAVAAAPVAAAFNITPRTASGDVPAGWNLTVGAAQSALLPAGHYLADARIEVGGGVIITESIGITLRESVTA